MSKLFESGVFEKPPKEVLAVVLLSGRDLIGKGEDDWDMADTCQVMELLPEPHKKQLRGMDAVIFKNWMQRLRKDKVIPKTKAEKDFVEKLQKIIRDFDKNRERVGFDHLSQEYVAYINSDEWRTRARQHRQRCNYRCQLCSRQSGSLDVHHTTEGYANLKNEKPWHLLAVCSDPCHKIADMMRQGLLFSDEDHCELFE